MAVLTWTALIAFSSTSQAGCWCEQVFHAVSAWLLQQHRFPVVGSDLVHFLAHKSVHVGLFATFAVLLWQARRKTESFRFLLR